MTDKHPITPPPELVHQWHKEACKDPYHGGESKTLKHVATQAAQWGADQELRVCCEWLEAYDYDEVGRQLAELLRAARRPKPPSAKQQALYALDEIDGYAIDQLKSYTIHDDLKEHVDTIRRALESLPDDTTPDTRTTPMTSRSERFIEEFESGKNMRHGIANVLKHLAYAFGDGEAVPISLIEEIVPELLERALAGDGDAARTWE